jgi:hypothetical protein
MGAGAGWRSRCSSSVCRGAGPVRVTVTWGIGVPSVSSAAPLSAPRRRLNGRWSSCGSAAVDHGKHAASITMAIPPAVSDGTFTAISPTRTIPDPPRNYGTESRRGCGCRYIPHAGSGSDTRNAVSTRMISARPSSAVTERRRSASAPAAGSRGRIDCQLW